MLAASAPATGCRTIAGGPDGVAAELPAAAGATLRRRPTWPPALAAGPPVTATARRWGLPDERRGARHWRRGRLDAGEAGDRRQRRTPPTLGEPDPNAARPGVGLPRDLHRHAAPRHRRPGLDRDGWRSSPPSARHSRGWRPISCNALAVGGERAQRLWSVPAGREQHVIVYGPGRRVAGPVAVALLDDWAETVPSAGTRRMRRSGSTRRAPVRRRRSCLPCHPTKRSRSPAADLPGIVLSTRMQAHARMAQPDQLGAWSLAVPTSMVLSGGRAGCDLVEPDDLGALPPGRADAALHATSSAASRPRWPTPLWMLGRQWQVGEHAAEDAASPMLVELEVAHTPLDPVAGIDPTVVPAEALLEGAAEDWWTVGRRVRVGRAAEGDLSAEERAANTFSTLPEPYGDSLAGEVDGLALWRAGLIDAGHPALAGFSIRPDFWQTETLTYETDVTAGGATLRVAGHDGGDVDWFTADADTGLQAPDLATRQVVPQRLHYPGAPAPRWWQIEDAAVDIGGFPPDRSHLATALLIELVCDHANDWFTVPVPPPAPVDGGPTPPSSGVVVSLRLDPREGQLRRLVGR